MHQQQQAIQEKLLIHDGKIHAPAEIFWCLTV